jgi:hypothetical protein|tara:strand:+ start:926 stop:1072 length:147 start_codon:yes stop_codon:yes gene_type:complete
MPIWLRRFTFEKLKDHYNEKKESEEKAYSNAKRNSKPNNPTYRTKAPK